MKHTLLSLLALLFMVSFCLADSGERFVLAVQEPPLSKNAISWNAVFTPDGRRVVIDSGVWDCKTGKLVCRIDNPAERHYAMSPNGKRVAFINEGSSGPKNLDHWYGVTVVETETGKHIHTFHILDSSLPGGNVAFNQDGTRIFASAYDRLFALNSDSGKIEGTFRYQWRCSCVSPDGATIIQVIPYDFPSPNGKLQQKLMQLHFQMQLRDLVSGKNIWTSPPTQGNVERAAFTSDGKYVFANAKAADHQGAMIGLLWDSATGKRIDVENTRGEYVYHVSSERLFGRRYLVMIDDKSEHNIILDLTTRQLIPVQVNDRGKSLIIGVAPDGITCVVSRYIAGGSPSSFISLGELKLPR